MAQKFNDGQTFGEIREILNGNADELTAATTNADAANATANEAVKVANSFDTSPYVPYGRVFAPSGSERGVKGQDNGSLWFNGGKAYTIDYVLPGGGSLLNALMPLSDKGDISVAISGSYTNGWKGSAEQTYHGVARIHYIDTTNYVTIEAIDTETAEMYVASNDTSYNWIKVGGGASGTAGGSLAGTYPNPTIKGSVNLPGSPTTTTQGITDTSTKIATTGFVKNVAVRDSFLVPAMLSSFNYQVRGRASEGGKPVSYGILKPFIFKNLDRVGICIITNSEYVSANRGFSATVGTYRTETVKHSPDGELAICIPAQTFIGLGTVYNSNFPPRFFVTNGPFNGVDIVCVLEPGMILPFANLEEFNAAESVDIYNLL